MATENRNLAAATEVHFLCFISLTFKGSEIEYPYKTPRRRKGRAFPPASLFRARKPLDMNKRIEDEFTHLKISRQRKYQLRMLRDRRCTECGQPAVQGTRCLKHLIRARERQRSVRGLKRRYYNTLSYQLERSAAEAASANGGASRSRSKKSSPALRA